MDWKKLLGSVTNSLDQELRLRNEYLLAKNRLLRQQVRGRLWLTDSDRKELAAIGQQLGRKALTVTAFIPCDQWQSPSPALSTIVFLPSVNARHIRDRPHRHRQRRDALLADDLREVA